MTAPTPREVAHARILAQLERALDEAARGERIQAWNEQIETVIADLHRIALEGTGASIEFSYTDNVIRAFPEPRLRPGSAALWDLDTGVHSYRDINPNTIGLTP